MRAQNEALKEAQKAATGGDPEAGQDPADEKDPAGSRKISGMAEFRKLGSMSGIAFKG